MKITPSRRIAAMLLGAAVCHVADAQTMDYGALETLFGEPVTTSATGSPQRVSEVPAEMEIISAEDIRRSGAHDLPGVLRHVMGVDILQWANGNTDVSVRGYDQAFSKRVLVLIDGRQVYADYFGFTPWTTLPVELAAIRQIEVVKGPASALFGFNAAGGVINIITYDPLTDPVDTASLTAGTQDRAQGSVSATVKAGDAAALRISGGAQSDRNFSTAVPAVLGAAPGAGNNRASIDVAGVLRLADAVELRIDAGHVRSAQFDLTPAYVFESSKFTTDFLRGNIVADTRMGLLQASAYTNEIDQIAAPGVLGQPLDFNSRLRVLQLQDAFKVSGDHMLRAAVEYHGNAVDTSPVKGARVGYHVLSAAATWEWQLGPRFALTNAARFDRMWLWHEGFIPAGSPWSDADWDRILNETDFNSGLVWMLDGSDTVRVTGSRGVLMPNLLQFGGLEAQGAHVNLTGAPALQPTVVTNREIDWDRALPAFHGQLRAAVFVQRTESVVSLAGGFIPAAGAPYITPSNIGDSSARGAELGLTAAFPEGWRWGLKYRLEKIIDRFEPAAQGGALLVEYQHTTPVHLINANLGWARDAWEIDVYGRYQSSVQGLAPASQGRIAATLSPVPAYLALDARLAYKTNRGLTLALSGQNLSQATQRQTAASRVERQVFGTVTLDF
jgi:iron complex outermembrane receptor protein